MGELDDVSRLASLTRRVSLFAVEAAGAFYFFSFGMSFAGFSMIAYSLASALGLDVLLTMTVFLVGGLALSVMLILVVAGPVWRHLAGLGVYRGSGLGSGLLIGLGFPISYMLALLNPQVFPVAWYPGVGLGLAIAGASMYGKTSYWRTLYAAGALVSLTTPLVVYTLARGGVPAGVGMANGLMLIIYLIAGSYSMGRASRTFTED